LPLKWKVACCSGKHEAEQRDERSPMFPGRHLPHIQEAAQPYPQLPYDQPHSPGTTQEDHLPFVMDALSGMIQMEAMDAFPLPFPSFLS